MNQAPTRPARTPRRRPQPQTWKPERNRREIVLTVAVVAAIVGATLLVIWMLRPESSAGANDGGLLTRQARIAWWIAIIVVVLAVAYAIGRTITRGRRAGALAFGILTTVIVAGILAWQWPGGLVVPQPKEATPAPPQALGSLWPSTPQPFLTPPPASTPSAPAAPETPTSELPAPPTTAQ